MVARARAAQTQVALNLERFDQSARLSRQAIDQAARFSAPVNCALEEANRRTEVAESDARDAVRRARDVAAHAVAASQMDANTRVHEANEAARCAAIQAENTTAKAQAQMQLATADSLQSQLRCQEVAARAVESEKKVDAVRQTAEKEVAFVKQQAEGLVQSQTGIIFREAEQAVQIERSN